MDTAENTTTLNKQPVSQEQLEEAQKNLPKNERIVEVEGKPGDFRKIHRMYD